MNQHSEDVSLIEEFLKGSEECFNRLVKRYHQRVYYIVLRIMGNHHDAEDVVQETFLRVYRSLKYLKEKEYFFTWLYKIAYNLCMTKKRGNKIFFSLSEASRVSDVKAEYHLKEIEKSQIKDRIKEALEKLPRQQKAVFVLRVYDELKFNEIAKITGLSVGGVKANYFNAVVKIKEEVKKYL